MFQANRFCAIFSRPRNQWRVALVPLAILAIVLGAPLIHRSLRAQSPQTLATFQMSELFGVAWPDQPIEFRYDGGQPPAGTTRMLGPNGTEVPFQWVSSCSDTTATKGCILVHSGLAPSTLSTWTLQSGITPSASVSNPVRLAQAGSNYEITNGLTGVRIITQGANPRPFNLAPIQGFQLADGTWTGAGSSPNLLYAQSPDLIGNVGEPLQTPMFTATAYNVAVVDSGPMKVVIRASYAFNRPVNYYGGQPPISPAGAGHYTLIVTVYANSKAILIDEDSDMQFSYYIPIYSEVQPDTARWKGHDSLDNTGTQNPLCGYDALLTVSGATQASPIVITASASLPANGQRVLISGIGGNAAANGMYFAKTSGYPAGQFGLYTDGGLTQSVTGNGAYTGGGTVRGAYQGWSEADPAYDAFQDLTYTSDMGAGYNCTPGSSHRKLVTNYPAADHAAGWYFEFYRLAGGASSPVVGMFSGDYSKDWFSATGPSMPGPYTSNSHWITGAQAAGIEVDNLLRGPAATTVTAADNYAVHRNWGVFVSTNADILPPASHQPIQNEQNFLTGINLSRLYTYQLSYPDPPGGWRWLYLSPTAASQLISWVRDGTSLCGSVNCYYNLLYNSETSTWGRTLLNMWKGNSTAAVQTALNTATSLARNVLQMLAAGDNHFDNALGYYQLGLQTSPETAVINAILMDSNTTATQKATAKAALALFGSLFWDNDWFPIANNTGESVGLSNQIEQYLQYRTQAVAAAPSQPFLAAQLTTALSYPTNDFSQYFSSTGAAAGSTHYQGTFFQPLILNYLNLTQDGSLSMTDPKWAAYANWELSIQTPPEPRFGNIRKGYSNGDGNTEADVRTGMLATALYAVNPALAGNLMWAWQQSNSATRVTEDSQFVTTLATIDPTIPALTPQLSSINIPGYHSVERYGFGSPNETAVWFINGGFYSTGGHRHADDGQVSIYAHSAPLAIDWNANLYYPETPGRFMHNSIVYDGELSHPWNADNAGMGDAQTLMQNPVNTEFASFENSTTSTANFTSNDGTVWTRTVRTMAFDPSYPIIYVSDAFAGPSAAAGKTLTWNMMAAGPVDTPVGEVPPVPRFSSGCQSVPGQFPSNGTVFGLNAGLQPFHFTGASWPKHATGGLDWDLLLLSASSTTQFMIGNWGHGCQSTREMGEYASANGSPFAEIQHILRIHDSGPFATIILPYRKTESPVRSITQEACGVQIVQNSATTCFNESKAVYSNGLTGTLTVYDGSPQSAFGVSVSGGPQEVSVTARRIVWTISGVAAGTRTISLAGDWLPNQHVTHSRGGFSYSFAGGPQSAPVSIVFTAEVPPRRH